MFCLPGICGLIIFLLARPQEFYPQLQRLPFLYLFLAAAIGGLVLDLKLRRIEPILAPTLPWAAAFFGWILLVDAVITPDLIMSRIVEIGIMATVYGTISHGIQRFRSLEVVAGMTMLTCLFLALVCWNQGLQDRSCVAVDPNKPGEGVPDGRGCELANDCYGPDSEPGAEYRCEKVGWFGTYSIEDRVRYRGELHDPNELSMTICVGGLSFAIAFALRRRKPWWTAFAALASGLVLWTVLMTMSRGGLVVLMAVPAVYFVNRYGWRGALLGAAVALPVVMLGGRSGESADESTFLRYEAWAAGLDMFKHNPITGVGHRMFGDHYFMTAHNSYVLTLSELGMIGLFLFTTMMYLSVKTVLRGVMVLRDEPGAGVARTWGLALLASLAGLGFQIMTLSFAYHPVLWIFFGFAGGYANAVRHHRPDFRVGYSGREIAIVGAGCVAFTFAILPLYLKWKHAM